MDPHEPDFAGIFHALPDPYAVLDRSLRVVAVNPAYLAAAGLSSAEVLNRPARDALGCSAQELASLDRVVHTGQAESLPCVPPWRARHTAVADAQGRVTLVVRQLLPDDPALDDASPHVRWIEAPVDMADRQRAQELVRVTQERDSFLRQMGDLLRDLQDPTEIQAAAARLLGQRLGAARAYYGEYDEDADRGVVRSDYRRGDNPSVSGNYRMSDFAEFHDLLRKGELVRIGDVETATRLPQQERARMRSVHVRAFMGQPLVKGGRLVAAFMVDDDVPRAWTALQADLVREAAERTWAAAERARAENALRAANQRKDEFLATLAHELRNPLAPLRNGIEIARLNSRREPGVLRNVQMMDRQLTHLVRLVNDLLEVGRVTTGKLELRRAPVQLQEVLMHSVEAVESLFDAQRLSLKLDRPAGRALPVMGDHDRLVQVFVNLLTNAVKYTEPGGEVVVQARLEGEDAVVRVQDTGIGIPLQELANVFDLFSQVRSHQARAQGGLGIGLSLVRSIVGLHGGRVSVDSEGPGRGSTFTVRLPRLAPAEGAGAA